MGSTTTSGGGTRHLGAVAVAAPRAAAKSPDEAPPAKKARLGEGEGAPAAGAASSSSSSGSSQWSARDDAQRLREEAASLISQLLKWGLECMVLFPLAESTHDDRRATGHHRGAVHHNDDGFIAVLVQGPGKRGQSRDREMGGANRTLRAQGGEQGFQPFGWRSFDSAGIV